ncbi:MAG TPA: hypothetical protein VGN15_03275 [Ktedonobacteraceae bacterium]|nr:hypothetical protein [Ktedonobacteraceae bacterium]
MKNETSDEYDYTTERKTHRNAAILSLQSGDSSAAIASALLAIETQFSCIADTLNGFYWLAKDDEI